MKLPFKIFVVIFALVIIVLGFWIFADSLLAPEENFNNNSNNNANENLNEDEVISQDVLDHISSKSDLIIVDSPQPIDVITSPLTFQGQARGTWYFEASFPVDLTDQNGNIIAQSYAAAVLDPTDPESTWMTEDFVPFKGTIEFSQSSLDKLDDNRGKLILRKDNPSGLPENDDALEIPVLFELAD